MGLHAEKDPGLNFHRKYTLRPVILSFMQSK
jgi:hypothetical protein